MTDIKIEAAAFNDMGRKRKNNEDSFYLNGTYMSRESMDEGGLFFATCSDDDQLYAICDGMGGQDSGEDASFTAVQALDQYFRKSPNHRLKEHAELEKAICDTSTEIFTTASKEGKKSGTTIVMALVHDGTIEFTHVGDSRAYSLRNETLTQVTKDHSLVQRLINMGMLDEAGARTHPNRHAITQYLGMPPTVETIAMSMSEPVQLRAGDWFLLCSDGLTDVVENDDITQILLNAKTAMDAAQTLVMRALENEGKDNITVICIRVRGIKESGQVEVLRRKRRARRLVNAGISITVVAISVILLDLISFFIWR